jgi:uncharacterized protein (TIGR00725 family)
MSDIFRLDRDTGRLFDAAGRRFHPATREWTVADAAVGEPVTGVAAATWLQRASGHPIRVPVGVIGPRDPTPAQDAAAEAAGRGLASMGFVVICGGRSGVMEAACRGAAAAGGTSIGLLPDRDPSPANAHATIVVATGLGEARNAVIARSALCLLAVGSSFGTLSEVAFGRQFGKLVIGLEGAPQVEGVVHVRRSAEAIELVARCALGLEPDTADRG